MTTTVYNKRKTNGHHRGGAATTTRMNPLLEDPVLSSLLKKLDTVQSPDAFQQWIDTFLSRFVYFLDETSTQRAIKRHQQFGYSMNDLIKSINKLNTFIDQGLLSSPETCTVKSRQALQEFSRHLITVVDQIDTILPSTMTMEQHYGYSKFHIAAVLIQDQFCEYGRMTLTADICKRMEQQICHVADKSILLHLRYYYMKLQSFCDVMADLGLFHVMLKCNQYTTANPQLEQLDIKEIDIATWGFACPSTPPAPAAADATTTPPPATTKSPTMASPTTTSAQKEDKNTTTSSSSSSSYPALYTNEARYETTKSPPPSPPQSTTTNYYLLEFEDMDPESSALTIYNPNTAPIVQLDATTLSCTDIVPWQSRDMVPVVGNGGVGDRSGGGIDGTSSSPTFFRDREPAPYCYPPRNDESVQEEESTVVTSTPPAFVLERTPAPYSMGPSGRCNNNDGDKASTSQGDNNNNAGGDRAPAPYSSSSVNDNNKKDNSNAGEGRQERDPAPYASSAPPLTQKPNENNKQRATKLSAAECEPTPYSSSSVQSKRKDLKERDPAPYSSVPNGKPNEKEQQSKRAEAQREPAPYSSSTTTTTTSPKQQEMDLKDRGPAPYSSAPNEKPNERKQSKPSAAQREPAPYSSSKVPTKPESGTDKKDRDTAPYASAPNQKDNNKQLKREPAPYSSTSPTQSENGTDLKNRKPAPAASAKDKNREPAPFASEPSEKSRDNNKQAQRSAQRDPAPYSSLASIKEPESGTELKDRDPAPYASAKDDKQSKPSAQREPAPYSSTAASKPDTGAGIKDRDPAPYTSAKDDKQAKPTVQREPAPNSSVAPKQSASKADLKDRDPAPYAAAKDNNQSKPSAKREPAPYSSVAPTQSDRKDRDPAPYASAKDNNQSKPSAQREPAQYSSVASTQPDNGAGLKGRDPAPYASAKDNNQSKPSAQREPAPYSSVASTKPDCGTALKDRDPAPYASAKDNKQSKPSAQREPAPYSSVASTQPDSGTPSVQREPAPYSSTAPTQPASGTGIKHRDPAPYASVPNQASKECNQAKPVLQRDPAPYASAAPPQNKSGTRLNDRDPAPYASVPNQKPKDNKQSKPPAQREPAPPQNKSGTRLNDRDPAPYASVPNQKPKDNKQSKPPAQREPAPFSSVAPVKNDTGKHIKDRDPAPYVSGSTEKSNDPESAKAFAQRDPAPYAMKNSAQGDNATGQDTSGHLPTKTVGRVRWDPKKYYNRSNPQAKTPGESSSSKTSHTSNSAVDKPPDVENSDPKQKNLLSRLTTKKSDKGSDSSPVVTEEKARQTTPRSSKDGGKADNRVKEHDGAADNSSSNGQPGKRGRVKMSLEDFYNKARYRISKTLDKRRKPREKGCHKKASQTSSSAIDNENARSSKADESPERNVYTPTQSGTAPQMLSLPPGETNEVQNDKPVWTDDVSESSTMASDGGRIVEVPKKDVDTSYSYTFPKQAKNQPRSMRAKEATSKAPERPLLLDSPDDGGALRTESSDSATAKQPIVPIDDEGAPSPPIASSSDSDKVETQDVVITPLEAQPTEVEIGAANDGVFPSVETVWSDDASESSTMVSIAEELIIEVRMAESNTPPETLSPPQDLKNPISPPTEKKESAEAPSTCHVTNLEEDLVPPVDKEVVTPVENVEQQSSSSTATSKDKWKKVKSAVKGDKKNPSKRQATNKKLESSNKTDRPEKVKSVSHSTTTMMNQNDTPAPSNVDDAAVCSSSETTTKKNDDTSKNTTPPAAKEEKVVPVLTEEERRWKCYMWYARLGQPNRTVMKQKIAKLGASSGITPADVDELPWVCNGMLIRPSELSKLMLNPEPIKP